ncbi:MAG: succinylglutamate desuccinylase/aspartoacylase family protein [bacterium]|jgi:predicted deacylase|nr:succinylglutamate desuccinylase/aspartoacylase family protein [bacterium]
MLNEIAASVWKINSGQPGKTVMFMGGTHGNERTGVEMISKLKTQLETSEVQLKAGTLILAHGNLRAIEISERGSAPHHDLNRSFPLDLLTQEPLGTYEDDRARELAPILAEVDIFIDLHATNKPSEPFVVCIHSPLAEEIHRWFQCRKVLSDPNYSLIGKPVTTDEYVAAHGGIGICYETGQASDTTRVDEVIVDCMNLLIDQGLIEGTLGDPNGTREVYEMTEPITLTEEGFEFENGLGDGSWGTFQVGDIIGHHGEHALEANYNGVVVFPKLPEHRKAGKACGYLARKKES